MQNMNKQVHKGIHKESGEEYAIKVIDKTSLSSHEKSLLRGEIGALKLVSHPNVVRLEAVHEDPRSISIVMTLCRGGDLWDKVRTILCSYSVVISELYFSWLEAEPLPNFMYERGTHN